MLDSIFKKRISRFFKNAHPYDESAPLGSIENPIRCEKPTGEREYLNRLRKFDGTTPLFRRAGSRLNISPKGPPIDMYVSDDPGLRDIVLHFDMYHRNYIEKRPPEKFLINNLFAPGVDVKPISVAGGLKFKGKGLDAPGSSIADNVHILLERKFEKLDCDGIVIFAILMVSNGYGLNKEKAVSALIHNSSYNLDVTQATRVFHFMAGLYASPNGSEIEISHDSEVSPPQNLFKLNNTDPEQIFKKARLELGNLEATELVLEACDFELARHEISDFHARTNALAEKEGKQVVFKSEYVDGWRAFSEDPCAKTARAWLSTVHDHPILDFFIQCCPGGRFYTASRHSNKT